MRRIAVSEFATPNVTPMIDVLLVLLIVFMVMVIRVQRTVDVQLPQPAADGASAAGIVLEVLPGPSYRINNRPVPSSNLRAKLTELYANRPEKIIQVAGSPTVTYGDVVLAMDIARSAGVKVIGIQPR
jgi:biopolymer transport protein ExbD